MTNIGNVGGASNIYSSEPPDSFTLNATVAAMGKQWYESAHSGTWAPPSAAQQKQWAIQLQQEATQDPRVQQFLNDNPSIINGLNNGTMTYWDIENTFKELSPFLDVSRMTPDEKLGFAQGWTCNAYNDVVSGYASAANFERFKESIHVAVAALELIPNKAALQAMKAAQEEVDSIVYKPGTREPLAFSQAATNTKVAMDALGGNSI